MVEPHYGTWYFTRYIQGNRALPGMCHVMYGHVPGIYHYTNICTRAYTHLAQYCCSEATPTYYCRFQQLPAIVTFWHSRIVAQKLEGNTINL